MGGFGGGRDSGGSGNTNREKGAAAARSSTSKSKTTSDKGNGIDLSRFSIFANIVKGASKIITSGIAKNKEISANNKLIGTSDYQGTTSKSNIKTDRDGTDNRNDKPQGIELAKASTGSATILGPAEIQKEATNNISGPTTTEMSADQITLANKRKGRRSTNITAKKTLANNYTLSKKTLLG